VFLQYCKQVPRKIPFLFLLWRRTGALLCSSPLATLATSCCKFPCAIISSAGSCAVPPSSQPPLRPYLHPRMTLGLLPFAVLPHPVAFLLLPRPPPPRAISPWKTIPALRPDLANQFLPSGSSLPCRRPTFPLPRRAPGPPLPRVPAARLHPRSGAGPRGRLRAAGSPLSPCASSSSAK
jgi:hypothetical protein